MYIKVRVIPEIKKEYVKKIKDDTYEVAVKEKREQNRANRRMLTLMAGELGMAENKIRIVSGHHSQNKIISIVEDS